MATPVPRALQRYRAKRRFDRTPEPAGAARTSSRQLEFVIQRHHARRLHYDFRLEWDGVLKSWAVPKGPSLDPSAKRLAVQVEDHPFEYRTFAGDIPQGEYGAGHVIIWDRGQWTPDGDVDAALRKGKLDFSLDGERLHGKWSLVRLKDSLGDKANWLLIKRRDEHALKHANGPDVTELYPDPVPGTAPKPGATWTRSGGASTPESKPVRRRDGSSTRTAARSTAVPKRAESTESSKRRSRKAPAFIAPQLATSVEAVPTAGRWLTELKFDGYRIVAYVDGDRVHCYTRSGHDWTHKMPRIAAALGELGLRDAWIDGELIAVDARGIPQFQKLQQALDPKSVEQPLLMVFDALQLYGADLRARPQRERKRLLQQALADLSRSGFVRLVDFVDGESAALREQACTQGYEGVILKDTEADYRSGRNRSWLKLKCRREQEFVIGGYTRTDAGRQTLTSLLLGYYDERGQLQFAGRAGTGFSEQQLGGLRRRLDALETRSAPFVAAPGLRGKERPHWVRPELVAQVRFAEWTESGILRQPLFLGLREDIGPANVRREPDRIFDPNAGQGGSSPARRETTDVAKKKTTRPTKSPKSAASRTNDSRPKARATPPKPASPPAATGRRRTTVQLTNPQRVLYPTDGVTKQQLAEYFEAIAPVLWPHLKARPLSLIRATSGQGRVFFQRHIEGESFPGLAPVSIPSSDEQPYFVCRSLDSIPLLAQIGAVELHTWGSRMPNPERADRMTFDLDPDPTLPWNSVREAATLVRELLAELGLKSLIKTSGGMGLHIVVPLIKGPPLEVAAAFSRRVAEHLARLIPQRFSAKRGAPNRQGKVYIDWQRNQFAATTVSAYSPRHRRGVPVSVPIDWDELGRRDIRAAWFNLRNVAARIAERGDAWADEPPLRQSLTQRVIDRLEAAAV
jgi:bifunctional non-homologous end joining protein LigD